MSPSMPLNRRRGSVLLLVLWLVIMLGAIGLSHGSSVRSHVRSAQAADGRIAAAWAARAGIEQARAMLNNLEDATLTDENELFDNPDMFFEQPAGDAHFTLVAPRTGDSMPPRYGLVDEGSRVNLNVLNEEYMTDWLELRMMDSLIDWIDEDDSPRSYGAESLEYALLENPYVPRNASLLSVRELLRVQGWNDVFRAAEPDPYMRFADPATLPAPRIDPELARRLLGMLTVWSVTPPLAPDGETKLNITSANARQMARRAPGLDRNKADQIVSWRGNNQFSSIASLLDIRRSNDNNNNNNGNNNNNREGNNGGSDGGYLFSLNEVAQIIDYFTIEDADEDNPPNGGININTAPLDVLETIPGMTRSIAEDIVDSRAGDIPWEGAGRIATISGVDREVFKRIYPWISATSSRFHVYSRGVHPASRAIVNIEAVLARERNDVRIVYYREY